MDKTVQGGLLHKDLAFIEINKTAYPLKIKDDKSDFEKPAGDLFLTAGDVEQIPLMGTSPQGEPVPTGKYMLYYKTSVAVNGERTKYTIRLTDKKGLSSEEYTVSTALNKPKPIKLYNTHTNPQTLITAESGSAPYEIMCTLYGTADIELRATTETAGAVITGNIAKIVSSTPQQVQKVDSGTLNSVKLVLPIPDSGEALYKITLKASGKGFNDGDEQVWYIKLKKTNTEIEVKADDSNAWKRLKEFAEKSSGPDIIIIDGEIKATNDEGNNGEITVKRNITIKGKAGSGTDKLNANKNTGGKPAHRIFNVQAGSTLTIENLTLTGAQSADRGGAVCITDGTAVILGGSISDNQAAEGGACYVKKGGLFINTDADGTKKDSTTTLHNNSAVGTSGGNVYASGGAICTDGEAEITIKLHNTAITDCGAKAVKQGTRTYGAVIYIGKNVTAELTKTEISKSSFTTESGGTFMFKNGGAILTEHGSTLIIGTENNTENACTFKGNNGAKDGGALYIGGTCTMYGGTITGNTVEQNGGGVLIAGDASVTMQGVTINGCFANGGGALYTDRVNGNIALTGCTIQNNKALECGGGINFENSGSGTTTVTMDNCTVEGNIAGYIQDSSAIRQSKYGGGIAVTRPVNLTITGGFIKNNKAHRGGGLFVMDRGTCTLTDVTVEGNQSPDLSGSDGEGKGAGIFVDSSSDSCKIAGSTIINANNEVYLNNGGDTSGGVSTFDAYLVIADALSGTASVATIVPHPYTQGRTILKAEGGGSLAEYTQRFTVAPNGSGQWTINNSGQLAKKDAPAIQVKITDGTSAEDKAYTGSSDYLTLVDEGSSPTPVVIYDKDGNIRLTVELTSGTSPDTEIWQNVGSVTKKDQFIDLSLSPTETEKTYTITLWTEKDGVKSMEKKTNVTVKKALTTYKELKNVVAHIGSEKTIDIGGDLTNGETGTNSAEIAVSKTLTIQSNDTGAKRTLDANSKGCLFTVAGDGNLTLQNLILKNGRTDNYGGAIYCAGATLKANGVIIENCQAKQGGAIYAKEIAQTGNIIGSAVTLTDTEIKGCQAMESGGGVYVKKETIFTANNSKIGGDNQSEGNSASTGGGIYVADGTVTMTLNTCTVQNNTAHGTAKVVSISGGGIYISSYSDSKCSITNSQIKNNRIKKRDDITYSETMSAMGAGISVGYNSQLTLENTTVTGNKVPEPSGFTDGVKGIGVYLHVNGSNTNARLIMKGSSRVGTFDTSSALTDGNDVYLSVHTAPGQPAKSTAVTVNYALSQTPAAQITPETYRTDMQVLEGSTVSSEYGKFKVTPQGGQNWKIDATGKLQK